MRTEWEGKYKKTNGGGGRQRDWTRRWDGGWDWGKWKMGIGGSGRWRWGTAGDRESVVSRSGQTDGRHCLRTIVDERRKVTRLILQSQRAECSRGGPEIGGGSDIYFIRCRSVN
jgi:hypothetical protein